jgi:Flp pilus assembly protein TadG
MRRRFDPRDASGATALEFALISPVLFMLLIGGFQLAWALHCAASVRWSLETSARNLMLNPTEDAATLKAAMLADLAGRATATDLTVTITPDTTNPAGTLLVASSVFRTNLQVPFLASAPLTFHSSTKVPTF